MAPVASSQGKRKARLPTAPCRGRSPGHNPRYRFRPKGWLSNRIDHLTNDGLLTMNFDPYFLASQDWTCKNSFSRHCPPLSAVLVLLPRLPARCRCPWWVAQSLQGATGHTRDGRTFLSGTGLFAAMVGKTFFFHARNGVTRDLHSELQSTGNFDLAWGWKFAQSAGATPNKSGWVRK